MAPSRAALVGAVLLLLLLPVASPSTPPTVTGKIDTPAVQRLVDALLAVSEVRAGLKDGDILAIRVWDSGHLYSGTVTAAGATMSKVVMVDEFERSTVHELRLGTVALFTLMNAYDTANTAKLLIKGGYISLHSTNSGTQAAFGLLVKTPADTRLATLEPKVGAPISHRGCAGELVESPTAGYLQVDLCGATYVVNSLGGVNARLARVELAEVCANDRRGNLQCALADGLSLSLGENRPVREACEAGLGPRPAAFPAWVVWDHSFTRCLAMTLLEEIE